MTEYWQDVFVLLCITVILVGCGERPLSVRDTCACYPSSTLNLGLLWADTGHPLHLAQRSALGGKQTLAAVTKLIVVFFRIGHSELGAMKSLLRSAGLIRNFTALIRAKLLELGTSNTPSGRNCNQTCRLYHNQRTFMSKTLLGGAFGSFLYPKNWKYSKHDERAVRLAYNEQFMPSQREFGRDQPT